MKEYVPFGVSLIIRGGDSIYPEEEKQNKHLTKIWKKGESNFFPLTHKPNCNPLKVM